MPIRGGGWFTRTPTQPKVQLQAQAQAQSATASTGPKAIKAALVVEQAGLLSEQTANAAADAVTNPKLTPQELKNQINNVLLGVAQASKNIVSLQEYQQLQQTYTVQQQKLDQLKQGLGGVPARMPYQGYSGGRRKHTRFRTHKIHKKTRRHRRSSTRRHKKAKKSKGRK